jgi:tripartite-type tricarboxylate transporter receptor subunit TctC
MLLFATTHALAQQANALRWIVPYPAGGGADATARVIAEEIRTTLDQPVVVDNRPGAATNIGIEAVRSARADGNTVGTADNAALAFNEHLFSKLSYDPKRDLSYIGLMARVPLVLVATPGLAASNFTDLLQLLRSSPEDAFSYASVGVGSAHHIAMELLKSRVKVSMTHVTYRGSAQAIPDLLGGQVQVMFLELPAAGPLIKTGKVKGLGIASEHRTDLLPTVPTLAEQGVKNFEVYGFMGMIGPPGLAPTEISRISNALQRSLQSPTVVRRFSDMGIEPMYLPSEAFYKFSRAESVRWGEVIRSAGIQKQ